MPTAKQRLTSAQAEPAEGTTATADPNEKPAKVLIREAFEAGQTRAEIAKAFGVTYQRVFSLTKGMTNDATGTRAGGARPKLIVVESEALTAAGREELVGMTRVDAARQLYHDEEMKIGAIAKLLGTSYQIIYQTVNKKSAAEEGDEGEGQEDESEESDTDSEEVEVESENE